MADDATPPPPPATTDADFLFMAQRDPQTRMLLARALAGEGNDPNVLISILNRARQSGQSVKDVLLTRGQFTSLDPKLGTRGLYGLSDQQLAPEFGLIDRPLPASYNPNMTDFYNPTLLAKKHAEDPTHYPNITPKFAVGKTPVASSGHQLFFEDQYKGGPLMATSTATGPTSSSAVNTAVNAMDLPPQAQASLDRSFQREEELEPEVSKSLNEKAGLYQQQYDAAVDYRKNLQAITDKFSSAQERLMDSMPDEEKTRQQELAKVSDQPLDPTRVLGQFLPMIAAIGGAFTRAGATGSLNAAAAAMNAARSHDDDALKRAHEQFQDRITEVMQKSSILHDEMTTALESSKGNWEAYLASMQVLAAKYDLPAAKLALERGNVQDLLNMRESLFKAASTIQEMNIRQADLEVKQRAEDFKESQAATSKLTDAGELYIATTGRYNVPGVPRVPANLGQNNPERGRIINTMADRSENRWHTGDPEQNAILDIAQSVQMRGVAEGVQKTNQMRVQVKGFVAGAENLAKSVEAEIGRGAAGPTGTRLVDRFIQAARTNAWTDKDVIELRNNLMELQRESGKIMEGSTGSVRAVGDKTSADMEKAISGDMSAEGIQAAITALRNGWTARVDGLDQEINDANNQILSEAGRRSQPMPGDDGSPTVVTTAPPAPAAPAKPTYGPGLEAGEKGHWVSQVEAARQAVREHRFTVERVEETLHEDFPNASEAQIKAAVEGM